MNLYISADMEGCTGVVDWKQCGGPTSEHFDWSFARRMMTHDVNAAIRGARAAGASRIVIKDSHNTSKNLLVDELEPGVELITGTRASGDGMMDGIADGFDGCFLIGYHAMAGTAEGVMEHTISGRVHRAWVNGQPAGEILYSALTAGARGVSLLMVSSDDKGVSEAQQVAPGIETAITKFGMGRYMARLLHPSKTGPAIEEAARRAVAGAPMVEPVRCTEPIHAALEFNRSEEADESSQLPGWNRTDAYTIEGEFSTWSEAHVHIRRAISHASLGG